MANLNDPMALDDAQADRHALLSDLQCNILSSHDRPNTNYYFLSFRNADQARRVLRGLAQGDAGLPEGFKLESELSSRRRRRVKASKKGAARYAPVRGFSTTLLLSAHCYRLFPEWTLPSDPAFQQGMSGRDSKLTGGKMLHDPPDLWGEPPVHAVFAVGYDPDAYNWSSVEETIQDWLKRHEVTVLEEQGYVLRHPTEHHAIEPFGYRDAISQPRFFNEDLNEWGKHEGAAAAAAGTKWSSFAQLSLVLVRDPNSESEDAHGTYVAYRKLRQKVDLFYEQAERLAAAAPRLPNGLALSRNEVADGLIGRKLDGTPLDGGESLNDFVYPNKSACPMHAHARKANPRDKYSAAHRIVRHGTVFGPKLKREHDGRPKLPTHSEEGAKSPDVGLLFFCCQANIENQFEFIQAQWANALKGGADAVIGQVPAGANRRINVNGSGLTLDYEPVVEVLAGEYFFGPSISFFSSL